LLTPNTPPFNDLTPAEDERLSILVEECSEVIKAAMKIQRHGYESNNKGQLPLTNRQDLERELGHVVYIYTEMIRQRDVNPLKITESAVEKMRTIGQYTHHQP